jgi:GT2 family glycosyltransferase
MIGIVSIVIPTYGSKGVTLTENCLKALWASGLNKPGDEIEEGIIVPEIVICDDGSSPEDLAALEKVCQEQAVAKLIHMEENTAHFGANVNAGIRATSGNVVVCLNNDVEVLPGCISTLFGTAASIGLGMCAPKLLYPDMRIQFAGMVYVPNPEDPNSFGWFDHVLRFQPRFHYAACGLRESLLTGACLMISRGVLDSIGMFDERFELTCEDVDLSLRCMAAGIPVEYVGSAEAIHHEGSTRGNTLADKSHHPEWNAKEARSLAFLFDKWPITHFEAWAPGGALNR